MTHTVTSYQTLALATLTEWIIGSWGAVHLPSSVNAQVHSCGLQIQLHYKASAKIILE